MILYFDTSTLIKQFLQEEGSEEAKRLARAADRLATSLVSYAECRGALARALRAGRLTSDSYGEALGLFEESWRSYAHLDLPVFVVQLAGGLAAKHFLRGLDAIHLASAVTLRDELGEPVTFSASDERLVSAAASEGLLTA